MMRKGGMWQHGVTFTKGREKSVKGKKREASCRGKKIPVLFRENDRLSLRQSQLFACRRFKIIHPVKEKKSERRKGRADGVSVGKERGIAQRETEQKDKPERWAQTGMSQTQHFESKWEKVCTLALLQMTISDELTERKSSSDIFVLFTVSTEANNKITKAN